MSFIPSGKYLRVGLTVYSKCVFNFIINCKNIFQSGYPISFLFIYLFWSLGFSVYLPTLCVVNFSFLILVIPEDAY